MARQLKDNCGSVYLFTNDLYEAEGIYKYGVTINPFERKRIQSNSTPPNHPFYDIVIIFSKAYKDIEKMLKEQFASLRWLISYNGENGGCEWIQHTDINEIVDIYKSVLLQFPDAELCYNGKRYIFENGNINEKKLPNCRLDFLGIKDGDKLKCSDGREFIVSNNKILCEGKEISLTCYMNTMHPREGTTNQHNGYQYFYFKGKLLYDMWQQLVNKSRK